MINVLPRGMCTGRTMAYTLMDAYAAAGTIRADISPTDMGAALEGIAVTSAMPEHRERAERLLDLTLDGLRARS
ncbi:hypothetical protein AB0L49_25805 [Streptomyces antimycoticus]|uniref:SbtR family transcriptional regulator n=1 Tax=Streptomyces antimycoticus TaxID=68175 RepID=UPI00343265B7